MWWRGEAVGVARPLAGHRVDGKVIVAEPAGQAAFRRRRRGQVDGGGVGTLTRERSDVRRDVEVPVAPFFGSKIHFVWHTSDGDDDGDDDDEMAKNSPVPPVAKKTRKKRRRRTPFAIFFES